MNTRHDSEKKQFKKLFLQEGVDDFNRRFQVLEAFLKTEKHVSCRELVEDLEKEGLSIGIGFVAETMELLCRFGFAHKVKFQDNLPRFEHRHLGMHHDHMVCTKCGKIIEFRDENLENQQTQLAAAYGFHMLQHRMEIYGICSDCLGDRPMVIPLARAKTGEQLMISELQGGKKAQVRLTSMGLRIGDTIEVVSVQGGGQLVIAAGESRFVIGRGLSDKIMVRRPESCDRMAGNLVADLPRDASTERMLLSDMKQGQQGTVVRVSGESQFRRRVLEMGINRGTRVYIEKYAPLKDPIELIVKGYHISMRVEEAAHICVEDVKGVSAP